jgi:hypothetical protein
MVNTAQAAGLTMKEYENAFLGLILAGVLLMIIGLGLMMTPARSMDSVRATFAEKQAVARAPAYTAVRASGTQPIYR